MENFENQNNIVLKIFGTVSYSERGGWRRIVYFRIYACNACNTSHKGNGITKRWEDFFLIIIASHCCVDVAFLQVKEEQDTKREFDSGS